MTVNGRKVTILLIMLYLTVTMRADTVGGVTTIDTYDGYSEVELEQDREY